jgi:putative ABC transport system permease protein
MWSKKRKQADFAAEIEAHINLEAERLRGEGLSEADALATARRKFGNVLQAEERFYFSQRTMLIEELRNDLRYAIRVIRHAPMFAATVVLTLALGIGATASIFAVADAALIRPLPFPDANRLVLLYERWQGELDSFAPADYLDFQRQSKSFSYLAAYRQDPFNLGGQSRPERIRGAIVTPNFFSVFSVPPQFGRTLDSRVDKAGDARKAVLSYSLWQRRYAGSAAVIGDTVLIDGEPVTVVGVMPPYFTYPGDAEMWVAARFAAPEHPLRPSIDPSNVRSSHYFDIMGRLNDAVSARQAQAEMEVICRRLAQLHANAEMGDGPLLVSLRDDLVGNTRPAILMLLAAVAVLLLIACANVANIVLARGAARRREMAIRGSLGAGRSRLVRQLLVEGFVLAAIGAGIGLVAARYVLRSLQVLLPSDAVPPGGLHVDFRLLAFATGISVLSTILFGLFPALQAAQIDLSSALKKGGRMLTSGSHLNVSRKVLLVTQVALSAILLTGAALLIHSLSRLLATPEGFSPEHVLSLQLSLPPTRYGSPSARYRFTALLPERVRSLPGVRSAAITSRLPLNPGTSRRGIEIQGRPQVAGGDLSPFYVVISPDYFGTLRIPLLEGRVFTDADGVKAPGAVVVNQSMARYFWPNEDPVGKMIKIGDTDWIPVIGVVGDVAQQGLDRAPLPAMYVPYVQDPWPALAVVIRTAEDPKNIASAAIASVEEIDKDQPVYNVRTMDEVVASSTQVRRFRTVLLGLLAIFALALAAIGTYGVMAYTVAQRRNEIGIRLALGAQPNGVRRWVIGEGLRLAGYGIAAGLLASLALSRFLSGILYGVKSTDPASFVMPPFLLLIAAFLASYIPARRAVRVDPAAILRSE